ncbi:MAG: hypothetical protein NTX83_00685 [Burkholderiales bacterium]|nr:hypothetical protein [Burkholderiales bacterium]
MTTESPAKKSFSSSIKETIAKKQAAQHPDSKDVKTDDKSRKRTAPPVGAGKVMKKAAGRGR